MSQKLPGGLLIAEDDVSIRALLEDKMQGVLFPVYFAEHGEAALKIALEKDLFLLISDVRMPVMGGTELARHLQEERPNLPVIFLTGFAEKEVLLEGVRAGILDVIEKPQGIDAVRTIAEKHYERRRVEIRQEEAELAAILDTFIHETAELLADIDNWIMRLEERPLEPAIVDVVFRKVHTIKGSAGAFYPGEPVVDYLHKFENILKNIQRDGLLPSGELIDVLLECGDAIRAILVDKQTDSQYRDLFAQLVRFELNSTSTTTCVAQEKTTLNSTAERPEEHGVFVTDETLAEFMTLAGELIILKNNLFSINHETQDSSESEGSCMGADLERTFGALVDELQNRVMHLRLTELTPLFSKFPRIVRQLAQQLDKPLRIDAKGAETKVDRSIAKSLSNCLIHLIRNAADHGIESLAVRRERGKSELGTITLTARSDQENLFVTVGDDGGGIEREKVAEIAIERGIITHEKAQTMGDNDIFRLLFHSGFSTKQQSTEVSGRGVGLDVVRNELAKYKGTIHITSQPGAGTIFHLTIPTVKSVNVLRSFVVRVGDYYLMIPTANVVKIVSSRHITLKEIDGATTVHDGEETILLGHFAHGQNAISCVGPLPPSHGKQYVVVIRDASHTIALLIDEILCQQDAVIQPFDGTLSHIVGYQGTASIGQDKLALVMDVEKMIQAIHTSSHLSQRPVEN